MLNLFLLGVGALMDILSAILIIAPLLAPMAIKLGIDPVHLGVIFIVNLEIGYLTPPMGLNLFVSSGLFNRPVGDVIKSTFPFTRLMLLGLLLVTYVPAISLAPVKWLSDEPEVVVQEGIDPGGGDSTAPANASKTTMADLMAAAGIEDDDDEDDDEDFDDEDLDEEINGSEQGTDADPDPQSTATQLESLRERIDTLEREIELLKSKTQAPSAGETGSE